MRNVLLLLAIAPPLAAQSPAWTPPRGLQDSGIAVPADNAMTPGKIRLGAQLFFDKRLSKTKLMSCETCHVPEKGWADGLALSPKFDGAVNSRHTPTLYGAAYYSDLSWDGRTRGLEMQILATWKEQMGVDPEAIARDVEAIPGYKAAFEKELGGPPTGEGVVKALATFVRTVHAGDTPWDRHKQDAKSLEKSDSGQGFKVFSEVARCTQCHLPPVYSDTLFHNVGIGSDTEKPDKGRGKILADAAAKAGTSLAPEDERLMGAFKTPSLRGVALSGPYFHDGRASTLEDAVDLMLKGGVTNPYLDDRLKPARVTPKQREQLLAFLRSLTPESKPYPRPALP